MTALIYFLICWKNYLNNPYHCIPHNRILYILLSAYSLSFCELEAGKHMPFCSLSIFYCIFCNTYLSPYFTICSCFSQTFLVYIMDLPLCEYSPLLSIHGIHRSDSQCLQGRFGAVSWGQHRHRISALFQCACISCSSIDISWVRSFPAFCILLNQEGS